MAHPYRQYGHRNDPNWLKGIEKYVEKASRADIDDTVRNYAVDRDATAKAAYDFKKERLHRADGGAIDESIDVSQPDEEGPYSLGHTMAYERARMDREEVDAGKRFYDTGTRIPGQQKAKNDAYEARLRRK